MSRTLRYFLISVFTGAMAVFVSGCDNGADSDARSLLPLAGLLNGPGNNAHALPYPAGSAADYSMENRDARGSVKFAFQTTATIAAKISFAPSAAGSRTAGSSGGSLVQFRESDSGRVIFKAVPDENGIVSGNFTINKTVSAVRLDFAAGGKAYTTTVDTGDLLKIDRSISMLVQGSAAAAPDGDGDGVPDDADDFPADPNRATALSFPTQGRYTIAFEDLYPRQGDADFNDYVVQARVVEELDAAGRVVTIKGSYRHAAKAAGYNHILKLNLPIGGANYTIKRFSSDGTLISTTSTHTDDFQGIALTERSDRTIPHQNALRGQKFKPGDLFEVEITPDAPVAKTTLGAPPYDLFLYVLNTRREVHFAGRFFNADGSDKYLDPAGFPWALLVPSDWRWMYERNNIHQAYKFFDDWYTSQGSAKKDWYNFPDLTKVFENVTTYLAESPSFTPPAGYSPGDFTVRESMMPLPTRIGGHFVPIGAIHDISPAAGGSITFVGGRGEIRYKYDAQALADAGYLEEFAVFWYDANTNTWKRADNLVTDTANSEVIAYTSHLTPFVLTALPAPAGGQQAPAGPACIANDYPGGIGGSAGAIFSTVDTGFKYYQDRNYTIVPPASSPTNTTAFAALGFAQAMGISTCNGGIAPCSPQANHKQFTGNDYINFVAHDNIDVYVMYDSRGGTGVGDTSQDAPWLAVEGFVDTGFLVETTDTAQFYTVYRRSYTAGQTVRLHGNQQGAGPGIGTNYWALMKRAGVVAQEPAAALCVAAPDVAPPGPVTNLQGAPGANEVLLTWQNPADADFGGVVIRRSLTGFPTNVNDGVAATGTVMNPQAFRDESVSSGNTYFYTVFALDVNNNFQAAGTSVTVTTGPDTDGDGLSDLYETGTDYSLIYPGSPAPNFTCDNLPCPGVVDATDTDADGVSDAFEIANGTDPTNPDGLLPAITNFTLTSTTPTTNSVVTFTLAGTDNVGITGWLITLTNDRPLASHGGFAPVAPTNYTLPAPGTYTLYVWARDLAGNVSNVFAPINVQLTAGPILLGGNVVGPLALTGTATTIVGSFGNYGATDGVGTAAGAGRPEGMTTDGVNLYWADTSNGVIRRMDFATQTVTTFAGTPRVFGSNDGVGPAAQFGRYLWGLTTDGTSLFLVDGSSTLGGSGNNSIRQIDIATATVTTLAGNPAAPAAVVNGVGAGANFHAPVGITTDGTNLYVTEMYRPQIRKIDMATGAVTTLAGNGAVGFSDGVGAAVRFKLPRNIIFIGPDLYVHDDGNFVLRRLDPVTGAVVTVAGSPGNYASTDGIGPSARFWGLGGYPGTDGTNIYLPARARYALRRFEIATASVTTFVGRDGIHGFADGTGTNARFRALGGVVSDGTSLYLADTGNNTIRRID